MMEVVGFLHSDRGRRHTGHRAEDFSMASEKHSHGPKHTGPVRGRACVGIQEGNDSHQRPHLRFIVFTTQVPSPRHFLKGNSMNPRPKRNEHGEKTSWGKALKPLRELQLTLHEHLTSALHLPAQQASDPGFLVTTRARTPSSNHKGP